MLNKYFISHSTADNRFIEEEIIPLLRAMNIETWYSKNDIRSATEWERSIKYGLEHSDGVILIMSHNSSKSDYVKDEVSWAIDKRPGKLLPVMISDCDPIDFHIRLPRIQYINYKEDERTARINLIGLLKSLENAQKRLFTIKGKWTGHAFQIFGNEALESPLTLEVWQIDNNSISGNLIVLHPKFGEAAFTLTGSCAFEKFFQYNYYSQQPSVIQFGAMLLELDPLGIEFKGKFVGYGAYSGKIITGDIHLKKN
ncbi:hypothetical protein A4D02_28810 [Niastella koreensis]|uniref:TIR domain-containing protein n=2 Tax=Niastella koreensis TaxID=354356 RepID=G8T773_NIAKG|nr:toll/interleukin-1 receptor domain-containing protein [Niastella koreensis]AEW00098.1 hypothetical protein Niako_3804 [Niastella koreensis GR20-10]OQP49594.1 hypothetical protein A4D02_28810 [Niastella koreensis]